MMDMMDMGNGMELSAKYKYYAILAQMELDIKENCCKYESNKLHEKYMENEQHQQMGTRVRELVQTWGLATFGQNIALMWLKKAGADRTGALARLRLWVLMQLNKQSIPSDGSMSSWQRGCPNIIPGLINKPIWRNIHETFPWVKKLEDSFPIIRDELLKLKNVSGFQPYRAPTWAGIKQVLLRF